MREAVSVLRRVTILFAVLLLVSLAVALLVPRPEREDDPTPRTVATAPAGGDVSAAVRATFPRDKVARATVGELVEVTVTSPVPDSASIEAFGLTEAAGKGAPARFSFLADRAGSFEVKLTLGEERTVGRLVVKP